MAASSSGLPMRPAGSRATAFPSPMLPPVTMTMRSLSPSSMVPPKAEVVCIWTGRI